MFENLISRFEILVERQILTNIQFKGFQMSFQF